MLPEQVKYLESFPFSIGFSNVIHELPHYHEEMEVVLVLKGSTNYKVFQQTHFLKEGDVLIIDTEDLHYIYDSSPDILMLTMHLNLEYFDDLYPEIDYMIFASSAHDREATHPQQENEINAIKTIMAELMMLSADSTHNNDTIMDRLHRFIYIITNHFQSFFIDEHEFISSDNAASKIDLSRLYRIIKYIYYNYDKKITLNDIAKLEHLSPYYISHMIKSTSGLNFQNFLSYMRMEFAAKSLADKTMTLTQISESCGFSSLAYMNKCFREWHGVTASEYQKSLPVAGRKESGIIDTESAMITLRPFISRVSSHQNIDLRSAFPLKIMLNSLEEIMFLYSNHDKIQELSPVSVILSDKLTHEVHDIEQMADGLKKLGFNIEIYSDHFINDIIVRSWISPLKKLIDNPHTPISLISDANGLFNKNGYPTIFYSIYNLLSEANGEITDSGDHYISFRSKDSNCLLLINDNKSALADSHIQVQKTGQKHIMVKRELPGTNQLNEVLNSVNNISNIRIKDYYYQYIQGSTEISDITVSDSTHVKVIADPDTILFVEVYPHTVK